MMQGPPMGGGMRGGTAVREGARRAGFSLKTFSSLKVPAYRYYFGGLIGQMAALNMQMVARSWFMYELTERASLLGAVALANALPMLSLSLFGGVLADRVQKRQLLLLGQIASAAVAFAVAVSITLGTISWAHLIVASLLQGIVMAMIMPARQAIIPELVGQKALTNAVALNAAAMNLLRLLAPAFAGYLIALWNVEAVYYLMGVLYIMGFLFTMRLPLTSTVQIGGRGTWDQLGDGLRYVKRNTTVSALLVFTLLATVLSMPYFFLLPAFTKDLLVVNVASFGGLLDLPLVGPLLDGLGESSARLGLLMSVSGVGAFVGALAVASMPNKRRGMVYLLSVLLMAVSLVVFSLSDSYILALLVFIPLGLGQAGRMALSNTLVQSYTEEAYLGRVMSVYMMEWGLTNVGVFLVAVMADFMGVQAAVGWTAGLLVAVTLYYWFFTSRIRKLD